jgi:hypothetical protein
VTVKQIITDYLKQNRFDGLYANDSDLGYACCHCEGKNLLDCGEACDTCEPAYKHKLSECKKCPDFEECKPEEEFNYCGKKK